MLEELDLYTQALEVYKKQNWTLAELKFKNLQQLNPDFKLYQEYAERVAYFKISPPAVDWDGVFIFQTK